MLNLKAYPVGQDESWQLFICHRAQIEEKTLSHNVLKLRSHQTRMYYGPPWMAPDRHGSSLCRSGVVRGRPGCFFLLQQSKFVDDSSSSRQRYELLHEITMVLLWIVTDHHGSTMDHPRTVPAVLCTTPVALRTVSVICEPSQITTDCPG